MTVILHSNFAHLEEHDKQLLRLGLLAERYFADDPNTSLLKLRQLTELSPAQLRGIGFVSMILGFAVLFFVRYSGLLP